MCSGIGFLLFAVCDLSAGEHTRVLLVELLCRGDRLLFGSSLPSGV